MVLLDFYLVQFELCCDILCFPQCKFSPVQIYILLVQFQTYLRTFQGFVQSFCGFMIRILLYVLQKFDRCLMTFAMLGSTRGFRGFLFSPVRAYVMIFCAFLLCLPLQIVNILFSGSLLAKISFKVYVSVSILPGLLWWLLFNL